MDTRTPPRKTFNLHREPAGVAGSFHPGQPSAAAKASVELVAQTPVLVWSAVYCLLLAKSTRARPVRRATTPCLFAPIGRFYFPSQL